MQLSMATCGYVFVYIAFLLATQLNSLPEENLLVTNCVCEVRRSITNTLGDGKYVLVFFFVFHPLPYFCFLPIIPFGFIFNLFQDCGDCSGHGDITVS